MSIDDFRTCAKNESLDSRKLRNLETIRLSHDGKTIMDVWYSDIFHITSFREWYKREIVPRLARRSR